MTNDMTGNKAYLVDYQEFKGGFVAFGGSNGRITGKGKIKTDREDLESLWKLVKERFKKTEPKNYSDDYLLKTLKTMFEQLDVEASVWGDQKGRYGLAKRYPLIHFTLKQMQNNVILEVEKESEMSLELLRLVIRQLNEGYVPE
nr:hypothetical protein [Tanacetum cinerariifolium]